MIKEAWGQIIGTPARPDLVDFAILEIDLAGDVFSVEFNGEAAGSSASVEQSLHHFLKIFGSTVSWSIGGRMDLGDEAHILLILQSGESLALFTDDELRHIIAQDA